MVYTEKYIIITFRSRYYSLRFNNILRDAGVKSLLMSTPREVAIGCGLSVRISCNEFNRTSQLMHKHPMPWSGVWQVDSYGARKIIKRINIWVYASVFLPILLNIPCFLLLSLLSNLSILINICSHLSILSSNE